MPINESPKIISRINYAKNDSGIEKNFGNSQGKNVLETKWLITLSGDVMSIKCLRYAF